MNAFETAKAQAIEKWEQIVWDICDGAIPRKTNFAETCSMCEWASTHNPDRVSLYCHICPLYEPAASDVCAPQWDAMFALSEKIDALMNRAESLAREMLDVIQNLEDPGLDEDEDEVTDVCLKQD